ncbi:competence protein ComEC [Frondihabitans sp. PhB188]|nr:competence protein ComEC [Frondihabitans sp. PhB188]
MIDVRLAAPAAAGWGALVLALPHPAALPMIAGVAAVGSCVLLVGRRLGLVAVMLGVVAALAGSAWIRLPSPESLPNTSTAVVGEVVGLPDPRTGTLTLSISRVGAQEPAHPLRTLVLGAEPGAAWPTAGDTVAVTGRLSEFTPGDPHALALRPSSPVEVVRPASGLGGWAADLRDGFARTTAGLPGDGGDLLPGLTLGDTARVSADLDQAMKRSSLAHLTAVSGANCAVVVAVTLMLAAALGVPRLVRYGAAALVLGGFVVLVTPEPSVQRAAVMALAGLALTAWGRPVRGLPLVSLAVVVLLLSDPWLARSFGFALSVLATAGLVVLTGPLSLVLARVVPSPIAVALAVPIAAQLACQPLLLLLDPGVPLVGIPANVLAEPAAPVATVLGLVACLLGPVWPAAAVAVSHAAGLPSTWIAAVARFAAGVPGARLEWGAGALAVGVAALVVLLAAAAVLAPSHRRARRVATSALLALLVPLAATTAGGTLGRRATLPADWQIAQCDVGQGDAVLVRSAGRVALVDTGDDAALLATCLQSFGIGRIDLLVLTHFDADHVGASGSLAGRVETVLVGPGGGDVVPALRARAVVAATPGASTRLGDARLTMLWPPDGTTPGNEASVVLSVSCASVCAPAQLTAVLLGDLGEREQARLRGRTDFGPVDVVKVSHHGSRDQSPSLYQELRPRIALIGVGADNTYGHPVAQTVDLLQSVGAAVVRSDEDGTVALARDSDGGIAVWRAGARVTAGAPRLDPGLAEPVAAPGRSTRPGTDRPEERHGSANRGQGDEGRPDRPGRMGRHSSGARDPGLGARAVSRRPVRPAAARPACRRRPSARGPRSLGRPVRPR